MPTSRWTSTQWLFFILLLYGAIVAGFLWWASEDEAAAADLCDPALVKFSSDFTKPKTLTIRGTGSSTVTLPAWVRTTDALTAPAPRSLTLFADGAQLPPEANVSAAGTCTVNSMTQTITYQAKCSSGSCTGGTTPQPTRTTIPAPTATGGQGPTALPSGGATPSGATRTAAVPTPQLTRTTVLPTAAPQPTTPPPVAGFTLPPLRPTTADTRPEVLDDGYPRRWCPLRNPAGGAFLHYVEATQTCMDAISEMSLSQMVKTIRVLRQIPSHWNTTDFCLSDSQGASAITAFLNPVYEGNFGEYRGDWAEDEDKCGKDYCKPHYCQKKARAFLLNNPLACAAATNAAETLDWLGLQAQAGRCIALNRPTTFPDRKPNKAFASMGTINYDLRQPSLTTAQLHLLHETHRCHAEASAARCGGPSATCSTSQAHLTFEASARNETEHHFFVMKRFFNDPDPRHSPAEQCLIARLEDYDHGRWMQAIERGDWAVSRKSENDHQFDHLCMILRDDRLLGRRTDCGNANVNKCPTETCAQILARAEAIMQQKGHMP